MVTQPPILNNFSEADYPASNGQSMADSTLQFRWIVTLKENLEILFAQQSDVFVAGDLLWYPVEGDNNRCQAPDTMVVFGRPKGERRAYQQWQEMDVPPQVVFEIYSHSSTVREMTRKLLFYQEFGVEEYYVYDPEKNEIMGAIRKDNTLVEVVQMQGWTSPRLGIHFEITPEALEVYTPNGERFLTPVELANQRDQERQRADQEHDRAERLAKRLQEMGVDPSSI